MATGALNRDLHTVGETKTTTITMTGVHLSDDCTIGTQVPPVVLPNDINSFLPLLYGGDPSGHTRLAYGVPSIGSRRRACRIDIFLRACVLYATIWRTTKSARAQ